MIIPERTQPGNVSLGAGCSMEWLHGGKIAVFYLADVQRKTIDVFIDAYTTVMQQWANETTFLMMVIAQEHSIFLTPYLRKRIESVIQVAKHRHIKGRLGVVLQKNAVVQVIKLFVKSVYNQSRDTLEPQLFFSQNEAMLWLEELLEADPT